MIVHKHVLIIHWMETTALILKIILMALFWDIDLLWVMQDDNFIRDVRKRSWISPVRKIFMPKYFRRMSQYEETERGQSAPSKEWIDCNQIILASTAKRNSNAVFEDQWKSNPYFVVF